MLRRVALVRTDVLLVTANAVNSSLILFALIIDVILSFETSVVTRATRHHIPEDGILNFIGYISENWEVCVMQTEAKLSL
jgi:hypothetical protein